MNTDLFDVIGSFNQSKVIVIGDAMLDVYLEGFTNRLSREAPVPVVAITARTDAPGGAANTAVNVHTLGGQVFFLSVIGSDADGVVLRSSLEKMGISTEHIIAHPDRQTISKRRVIASSQILVRFDQGDTDPIDAEAEDRVIQRLAYLFPQSDAIIISDYAYGVLTPRVIQAIKELQQKNSRIIVADAKDLWTYRELGITAVKPNYAEAVQLLGLPKLQGACARVDQITPHGDRILELSGAQIAAVTLDSEGSLVFERGALPYRTYAQPMPDSRAAGAGDTFVAALTLALVAGADTPTAAETASVAAGIVVNRDGTTSCSINELQAAFLAGDKFVADPAQLAARLELHRQQCKRVVFTNGCFDILHRGHIAYLNQAKAQGDVLVLGVNSDESVRRLKGPNRPINSLEDRIQVLSALSSIDYIIAFDEDTPEELIRAVRPDVFVKGGDYTRDTLPEAELVERLGGTVKILPYIVNRSTTGIIDRIREVYADGMPAST